MNNYNCHNCLDLSLAGGHKHCDVLVFQSCVQPLLAALSAGYDLASATQTCLPKGPRGRLWPWLLPGAAFQQLPAICGLACQRERQQ